MRVAFVFVVIWAALVCLAVGNPDFENMATHLAGGRSADKPADETSQEVAFPPVFFILNHFQALNSVRGDVDGRLGTAGWEAKILGYQTQGKFAFSLFF